MHAVLARDGLERGELLERRLAEPLVAVDAVGRAGRLAVVGRGRARRPARPRARSGPRPRPRCARCCDCETEPVAVVAGDAPLVGDAFGALELRRQLVVLACTTSASGGRSRPAPPRRAAPAHIDSTPQTSATSTTPAFTSVGREVRRLLRRAALRSRRCGRDREREARAEPRGARDVERLLADLAHAAADDLTDERGIDARPFDRGLLHTGRAGRRDARSRDRRCACPSGDRTASTMTTSVSAS